MTLDLDNYLVDETSIPCYCNGSKFNDTHHQHIITGDLSIIENTNLRKLLSKGPKYREPKDLDFEKARNSIFSGLNECIDNWCE